MTRWTRSTSGPRPSYRSSARSPVLFSLAPGPVATRCSTRLPAFSLRSGRAVVRYRDGDAFARGKFRGGRTSTEPPLRPGELKGSYRNDLWFRVEPDMAPGRPSQPCLRIPSAGYQAWDRGCSARLAGVVSWRRGDGYRDGGITGGSTEIGYWVGCLRRNPVSQAGSDDRRRWSTNTAGVGPRCWRCGGGFIRSRDAGQQLRSGDDGRGRQTSARRTQTVAWCGVRTCVAQSQRRRVRRPVLGAGLRRHRACHATPLAGKSDTAFTDGELDLPG
jgi:hypothetical protein